MKRESIAIANIYVPVKRRATLDQKRVDEIATSMLDNESSAVRPVPGSAPAGRSLKACIGWKPPKHSVKKLFSVSLSMRGGIKRSIRRRPPLWLRITSTFES